MNRDALEEWVSAFDPPEHDRLNRTTPEIYQPCVMLKEERIAIHPTSRVDAFCKFEGGEGIHVGRFVHIASHSHIGLGGGRVYIGDYVGISSGCVIISGSNDPDMISMSAVAPEGMKAIKHFSTRLERYSGMYAKSIVMPGVTLHEGALLGANSLALEDIPEWQIWAGNPARFIRMRERRQR